MSGAMTMGDTFAPQVAVDTILTGLAGTPVLYGSPAVVVNSSLGSVGGLFKNKLVDIPYFGHLPAYQLDVPEKTALAPDGTTETSEQARVKQAGVRIAWSTWEGMCLQARERRLDPYTLFGQQIATQFVHAMENELITAARTGLSGSYIYDGSADTITWDSIVRTRLLLGDEARDTELISVHSKVKADLMLLKDGNDRPLLIDVLNVNAGNIPRVMNVPLLESDLNYVSSADPPLYDSLIIQRGALALWHSIPTIERNRVPESNIDELISWFWYVPYRYNKLPGKTRGGVLINRTQ